MDVLLDELGLTGSVAAVLAAAFDEQVLLITTHYRFCWRRRASWLIGGGWI
ncbi:MAG: hypothetical protein M5U34_18905 [Chloroflexi bacterium]|nr:hypothetical protein [Chloroflexota bacterium]